MRWDHRRDLSAPTKLRPHPATHGDTTRQDASAFGTKSALGIAPPHSGAEAHLGREYGSGFEDTDRDPDGAGDGGEALTQCCIEEHGSIGVQLTAADIGVFEELRLAQQVGFGSVGQTQLVIEDRGVGCVTRYAESSIPGPPRREPCARWERAQ